MADVSKLLAQLERHVEAQEESKIGPAIERVLAVDSRNGKALRCKVIFLLHQEKFLQAMSVLEQLAQAEPGVDASLDYIFHKGYTAYRLLRYQEAKDIVKNAPRSGAGDSILALQHLRAQIHYNLEEYEAAAEIYEELLQQAQFRDEQDEIDLRTNYTAACAMFDEKRAQNVVRNAREKSYDILYNMATAELEARDYDAALKSLAAAEAMCAREHPDSSIKSFTETKALSDLDLHVMLEAPLEKQAGRALVSGAASSVGRTRPTPERLFFEEVSTIWVQRAFVYYVRHEEAKAEEILRLVLEYKPKSAIILAVASINWAAIKRHSDFFDTHRKLKATQATRVSSRLTTKQRLWVRYNTALLLLNCGNISGCKRQAELIAKDYPNSHLTHALMLAIVAREQQSKKSSDDSAVSNYLVKYHDQVRKAASSSTGPSPVENEVEMAHSINCVAAQIYLESGNVQRAVSELCGLPAATRYRTGVVATIASWKLQMGEADAAAANVVEALGKQTSEQKATELAIWAALVFYAHRCFAQAVTIIEKLYAVLPSCKSNPAVAALGIVAVAQYDVPQAKQWLSMLPEGQDWVMQTDDYADVDALESAVPSRHEMEAKGYTRTITGRDISGDGDMAEIELTRKKPRKAASRRMRWPPKNKDGKIDPERWVAISLRSYIKEMPERRRRELKRQRAAEQEILRKAALKRKAEAQRML